MPDLEARMNQVLLPLLSVVPEGAYREAIMRYARRHAAQLLAERGDTVEGNVLTVVAALAAERDGSPLAVAAIADAVRLRYGSDYDRPISNRYVGSVLRRLGLTPYKSHGTYVLAVQDNDRLRALYRRFGITVGAETNSAAADGEPVG